MALPDLDAEILLGVLSVLPGTVLIVDEARMVRFVNRATSGHAPEAYIGADAFEILAPENRVQAAQAMDHVFDTGEPTTHLAQVLRPDGGHDWYESRLISLTLPGRNRYVIIASQDVTARVEAERELAMVQSLLPLCSWCKKIRTEADEWQTLEAYLEDVSESHVTHGMCPDCEQRFANGDDRQSA
ncbi:MAG: PAS domain-containing protein [Gemmatimonadota bacterium]